MIRIFIVTLVLAACGIAAHPQRRAHADLYFCEDCAHSVPGRVP